MSPFSKSLLATVLCAPSVVAAQALFYEIAPRATELLDQAGLVWTRGEAEVS